MLKSNHWDRAKELMESQHREKLQAMSEEESIKAFCGLMAFALSQKDDSDDWKRICESRWKQKLVARAKWGAALQFNVKQVSIDGQ